MLLDLKSTPDRILRLLDTTFSAVVIDRKEFFKTFCTHTEASYTLDRSIEDTVKYLL
jgi:hypothetical protein